jgi:phosphoserine phosphatase RsbU/P
MLRFPREAQISSDQVVALLRREVADIIVGSFFLFMGLAACGIAGMRPRSGMRIFAWLGIWSAMYGAMQITQSRSVVTLFPRWLQISVPYLSTAMAYLLAVAASLAFVELSLGRMKTVMKTAALIAFGIAVAGLAIFVLTGSENRLMLYNNLLAVCILLILLFVTAVPALFHRYFALRDRGVLAGGMLLFAIEALYNSLSRPLGFSSPRILDHLGFAILLFSFGYAALKLVLANESRLRSLDNELAVARRIQFSILPGGTPELDCARISAVYRPMTEVAGDFYEFLPVDRNRAGFFVADVCGHGVPAALIASMVKVAVQTVAPCASDPGAVLRGLNRVLSGQLRGQLVSAAYLWLDTENRTALYSAAGHPPLLRWRQGKLEPIESNGLIFGVMPQFNNYPVHTMAIARGDRFLLYTDGVTEPENAAGESFGEGRLEHVVRGHPSATPSELSEHLLAELRNWQPASASQQDDITLIVIDAIA